MRKQKYCLALLLLSLIVAVSFTYLHFQNYRLSPHQEVVISKLKPLESSIQKIGPQHILIPAIGIDASIQHVGLTKHGAMEVPSNTTDAGWYKFGPHPGQTGSAVITGHYDGENGTSGVFEKLHLLKKGDKIYIKNSNGEKLTFIVRESRMYNPEAESSEVFNKSDSSHLNLITCDGKWDNVHKSYSKRLVVLTDVSH